MATHGALLTVGLLIWRPVLQDLEMIQRRPSYTLAGRYTKISISKISKLAGFANNVANGWRMRIPALAEQRHE